MWEMWRDLKCGRTQSRHFFSTRPVTRRGPDVLTSLTCSGSVGETFWVCQSDGSQRGNMAQVLMISERPPQVRLRGME